MFIHKPKTLCKYVYMDKAHHLYLLFVYLFCIREQSFSIPRLPPAFLMSHRVTWCRGGAVGRYVVVPVETVPWGLD